LANGNLRAFSKSFKLNLFIFSGMHHNSPNCDSLETTERVKLLINEATSGNLLFPNEFVVSTNPNYEVDLLTPNGGWSDPRDIILCLNMTLKRRGKSTSRSALWLEWPRS